jgi:hypothetical protein
MFDSPSGGLAPLRQLDAPLRMPLDPTAVIVGALPHQSVVFKSALSPIAVTFRARPPPPPTPPPSPPPPMPPPAVAMHPDAFTADAHATHGSVNVNAAAAAAGGEGAATYGVIVKTGDDLRQVCRGGGGGVHVLRFS